MTHDVKWMKEDSVLYANYFGHQTIETITACLDDMATELDKVTHPVMVLINWLEVTETEPKALFNVKGHRAYSHPMAARGILVGMPAQSRFENEVTASHARDNKNTQYYSTMEEALAYLNNFLDGDVNLAI